MISSTVPQFRRGVSTLIRTNPLSRALSTVDQSKSVYVIGKKESEYKLGKHRSNALELIQKQPIIEVEGNMAVCDGGGGALGHPLEYIKLYPRPDSKDGAVSCIYCGLKYRKKGGGH